MDSRCRPLLAATAVALVATACGSAPLDARAPVSPGSTASPGSTVTAPAIAPEAQVSDGGGVTVEASWAGVAAGPVFQVSLDTHSGDLDGLDLADALLRTDRGETLRSPTWDAPKGGHHRAGTLTFEGGREALAKATWIELVIPDVGGVSERALRWDVR